MLDFLRRAADDPQVLAIKMTLYRAGSNSEAVRALVRAAENGKQVAVSIELKARFDEANNIAWAAHAGARRAPTCSTATPRSKTHAKVVLVVRREGDGLRRYVHLATGNYNASTARLYTDLGLLTADPQIGEDVVRAVQRAVRVLQEVALPQAGGGAPPAWPTRVLAQIEEQAARARAGKPAHIFAKMNSLVDVRVIQALYRASRAGVTIDLCVRGICCLRPGVPGVSENIRVHSMRRALPRARARVRVRRPRARSSSSCRRPTGCRATSTAGSR